MYSIPMSIVDFIPVTFFGIASFILQRDLYNKMSKGAFSLFCAGTIDVFMAGFLKALYKLLYAANVCDFKPLSQMFFPVQALGFVLAGVALICMITRPQGITSYAVAAPTLFSGTFIFVSLMVLGLLGMNTSMSVICKKMKKPAVIVLFVVSFLCSLTMGYLSAKDFSQSYMNWIAEAINVIGQGSFFAGALILDKAGLQSFSLEKKVNDND